jgi:hypothetical protein
MKFCNRNFIRLNNMTHKGALESHYKISEDAKKRWWIKQKFALHGTDI